VATESERSEPPEGAERDWGDRSPDSPGRSGAGTAWDSPPETSGRRVGEEQGVELRESALGKGTLGSAERFLRTDSA